jgi:DNA replication protein DnaC
MLNNATYQQLKEMRLYAMGDSFKTLTESGSQALPVEEGAALMVEAEYLARANRRVAKLISRAAFRFPAVLEDIDYSSRQGITKPDIVRLSTGLYIKKHQNVFLSGPTGVGKTYIACALGRNACNLGTPVIYIRLPVMLEKFDDARLNNTYQQVRSRFATIPLLILDDWGLKKFTPDETQDVMELFERRYDRCSTIFAGQLPPTSWHQLFPDPTLADAILDRFIHNAYRFNLTGDSMRKTLALKDLD